MGWMQNTNKFRFVASSVAGIPAGNIVVKFNGVTVPVTLTGNATSWSGTCSLAPSMVYTAVITVTDSNNFTATATVNCDTFNPGNYTWEAEDYDFGNGQFYDNPQLNAYFGLDAVEGVDFHDTANGGSPLYRLTSTATEKSGDLTRSQFDGVSYIDYDIGYTATDEWLNYTRNYPTGAFNVFLRAARGTGGTGVMGLGQVISGRGTSNQVVVALGTFRIPNTGAWQTYQWVPLQDASGQRVTVELNGLTTLRLTDGGANISFLALAPAPYLEADRDGNSIKLSFGTEPNFTYSVMHKTSLSDSGWTELTAISGDGSAKSVSYPMNGPAGFYTLFVH
jgi:hypothetical protein